MYRSFNPSPSKIGFHQKLTPKKKKKNLGVLGSPAGVSLNHPGPPNDHPMMEGGNMGPA